MYYKIRRGIFETNSSSTHSITMRREFDKPQKDLVVSDDGYVHSKFGDFEWEFARHTDSDIKLSYLLTMVFHINRDNLVESLKPIEKDKNYIDSFYELDDFQLINDSVKRRCDCSGIIIDSAIICSSEYEHEYLHMYDEECHDPIYGIDHQSREDYSTLDEFLDQYEMSIGEFIFDPDRVLKIDNDNDPHYDDGLQMYPDEYENGTYTVKIYEDGTKVRESEDGRFIPDFAESIDITITEKCNGNCPYCYANCTPEGKHFDLDKYEELLNSIHPHTEIAINGNDLSYRDLEDFICMMRYNDVIVNMTINEKHFIKDQKEENSRYSIINRFYTYDELSGLGISLSSNEVSDEFIMYAKRFPNAVIHVIAGIVTVDAVKKLIDNDLKVLILGYKNIGRGNEYYNSHESEILAKISELSEYIKNNDFNIISFDNLAIEQLDIKSLLSKDQWDKLYMGDDGEYTFYMNLVEGYYAKSSLSDEKYPIPDDCKDVGYLFRQLQRNK